MPAQRRVISKWLEAASSQIERTGCLLLPLLCPNSKMKAPLRQNNVRFQLANIFRTVWPSGLRRWLKAPVRKGVGSNPTAAIGDEH